MAYWLLSQGLMRVETVLLEVGVARADKTLVPVLLVDCFKAYGDALVVLRKVIWSFAIVSLGICVARCTPPVYESEIVFSVYRQIAFKVGRGANPEPAAAAHCARYGTIAVLRDATPAMYIYVCSHPSRTRR